MSTKISVLILEDQVSDAELIVHELRKAGFDPDWERVESEPDYLTALDAKPELILANWSLPQFSCSSALQLMKDRGLDIPFIIISESIGEEIVLEALRQGASDYVWKDRLGRLGQAIKLSLEGRQLRDQCMRAEEELNLRNILLSTQQDVSLDGILVVDGNDEVISYNRRFIEMMGIPQELIKKKSNESVLRFVTEQMEAPQKFLQQTQYLYDHKSEISKEEIAFKNGNLFECHSAPMFGSGGRYYGRIWYFCDTTKYKLITGELGRQAEELRRQNEELTRLYRASGALISGSFLNVQMQAKKIVEVVQQEFGQDNCSLFIVREGSNDLERLATAGPFADQVMNSSLTLNGSGLVARAMRNGQTLNVANVHAELDYLPNWDAAWSELTIPLMIGENVIGAIDVQSHEGNAFSADDERLMDIFAERAALALERSRLTSQTDLRVHQLLALRTIDMAITSNFEIDLTLGILLDQIIGQIGVHAADILILETATHTLKLVAERGLQSHKLHQTQLNRGIGYAWQAIRDRRTVFIPDMEAGSAGSLRFADFSSEKFAAYLGIPLTTKSQIHGVLEIFHREPLRLEPDGNRFLEILAGQAAIAIDNSELFDSLQSSNSNLNLAYNSTLEGWAGALELRDPCTSGHTRRATDLTIRLAQILGIYGDEITQIYRGAVLHDIGKMGLPDSIMLNPGPLTDEEWVIMRKHPQYAYDLLSHISYLCPALDIPYCHHEKWDGSGYPQGLREKEIPLSARIFAVVDVWDALTSDRPYRKAWSQEKAIGYISEQSGKHFDPEVVEIFLREIILTKKDMSDNESTRQLVNRL